MSVRTLPRSVFQRFLRSRAGNVGIIFGLALTPILVAAGAAIDYSGAAGLQTVLQAATDSTTLSLCKAPATLTVAELRTLAESNLAKQVTSRAVSVTDLQVINSPRNVRLQTASTYPTAFMKIVSHDTVVVAADATCSASEQFFEIALVLDTTGSMARAGGNGQTKMDAAKTAAKDFVDFMYTAGALPGHVRMSLVPFAASVAIPAAQRSAAWLDTTAASPLHWQYITGRSGQGFTSRLSLFEKLKTVDPAWDWRGCVESPVYPYNVTDEAVSTSHPAGLILPLFAPDEVSNTKSCSSGSSQTCQDTTNTNSYLDDGTSSSGTCQNDAAASTRMTQACKYKTPTNARTSAYGPNWSCTSRPLSQLGTAQATLKTEITALQPEGQTNVHEGFMWGWRTISPTSVFSSQAGPPAAYDATNYSKVIVLMTDGTNTWSGDSRVLGKSQYSAYGYFQNADGTDAAAANSRFKTGRTNLTTSADGRAAIDELLLDACTNAKAKKVIVYTVGFSTSTDPIDAQGLSLLQNCASGSDYSFVANDSTALVAAFKKIAQGIGSMRLTR
ncbi:pilus assembly protein [Enterovirga sp.]|jgi:Flp pilus assembly protein TadG|uniref:pilus assembly protein n=1 Tax=Enterovirga sp. TaxID=2026350 RepID=UPI0026321EA1|nr:pilus assembly protein [Enterovirga sp.]MDB5591636.1 von willebrand factor type a [Enterovirga sp.]